MPNGWAWARLGNIGEIITGGTPSKSHHEYYGNAFPFFKPADLDQGRKTIISSEYLSEKGKSCCRIIPKFSTAVCCIGSIGKCGYLNVEGTTNQQINSVIPNIDSLYAYYYCSSDYFLEQLLSLASATTIAIVNKSKMESVLIPVPPMVEQKKIANTLDTALGLIETLEVEKSDIIVAINSVKSKILDLAIRGKLVPQDPNDEPASVLLERVRAEKEELIKQGKIKRDKKESVIFKGDDNSYYEKIDDEITCIDDEIPFEIPDNWCWARLSSFTEVIMGSSPRSQDICRDSNYTEFHQGKIYFSDCLLKESNQYTKKISKIAPKNSVLLCVRAPVGEVNITDREICIGRGLSSIHAYDKIQSNFLFYWLKTQKHVLVNKSTGSTFSAITVDTVKKILLPIPPITEQLRITQKILDLNSNIESIKASLL